MKVHSFSNSCSVWLNPLGHRNQASARHYICAIALGILSLGLVHAAYGLSRLVGRCCVINHKNHSNPDDPVNKITIITVEQFKALAPDAKKEALTDLRTAKQAELSTFRGLIKDLQLLTGNKPNLLLEGKSRREWARVIIEDEENWQPQFWQPLERRLQISNTCPDIFLEVCRDLENDIRKCTKEKQARIKDPSARSLLEESDKSVHLKLNILNALKKANTNPLSSEANDPAAAAVISTEIADSLKENQEDLQRIVNLLNEIDTLVIDPAEEERNTLVPEIEQTKQEIAGCQKALQELNKQLPTLVKTEAKAAQIIQKIQTKIEKEVEKEYPKNNAVDNQFRTEDESTEFAITQERNQQARARTLEEKLQAPELQENLLKRYGLQNQLAVLRGNLSSEQQKQAAAQQKLQQLQQRLAEIS
jgi:hypothetical protein